MAVEYRLIAVGDVDVFYREAGPPSGPTVLLLHGFPTSSHMFRDLIPRLPPQYRIIAPDLPGFGQTVAPPRGQFAYTFDNLARVIGDFVDALGLERYALYVFDYGAPVGYRLALAHPGRVAAIVSQNGTPISTVSATPGTLSRPIGARLPHKRARLVAQPSRRRR